MESGVLRSILVTKRSKVTQVNKSVTFDDAKEVKSELQRRRAVQIQVEEEQALHDVNKLLRDKYQAKKIRVETVTQHLALIAKVYELKSSDIRAEILNLKPLVLADDIPRVNGNCLLKQILTHAHLDNEEKLELLKMLPAKGYHLSALMKKPLIYDLLKQDDTFDAFIDHLYWTTQSASKEVEILIWKRFVKANDQITHFLQSHRRTTCSCSSTPAENIYKQIRNNQFEKAGKRLVSEQTKLITKLNQYLV